MGARPLVPNLDVEVGPASEEEYRKWCEAGASKSSGGTWKNWVTRSTDQGPDRGSCSPGSVRAPSDLFRRATWGTKRTRISDAGELLALHFEERDVLVLLGGELEAHVTLRPLGESAREVLEVVAGPALHEKGLVVESEGSALLVREVYVTEERVR